MKYHVVILCAGESRRMGFPKPILLLQDRRLFIQGILDGINKGLSNPLPNRNCDSIPPTVGKPFSTADKNPDDKPIPGSEYKIASSGWGEKIPRPRWVIMVVGYHKERILSAMKERGIGDSPVMGGTVPELVVLENPHPEEGMISSIKTALKSLSPHSDGILLCLADHPLVKSETYSKIIKTANENRNKIVLPQYGNRRGHPVFFPSVIFDDLLSSPLDQGAKYAVNKNREKIITLPVEDPAILHDIDTPQIYRETVHPSPPLLRQGI